MFVSVGYIVFAQDAATDADTTETQDNPVAYKQVLIDFTKLGKETNDQLAMSYGNDLSLTLPEDEAQNLPTINYAIDNWVVTPNSSIRTVEVFRESRVEGVTAQAGKYEGQMVLGVKIQFPDYNFDMFVDIAPPFLPNTKNVAFLNNGYLDNVGSVKSAYMTVYGLYQPEKIYLITEDTDGLEYQYAFGSLDFIGWRELEWINPAYIQDVRDRESDTRPLYPRASVQRRFKNIKVQRSAVDGTTDFVTYIKDIAVTYDKSVNDDLFNDFANEETWKILADSVSKREEILLKRTTIKRYFEYLEQRKQYNGKYGSSTSVAAGSNTGDAANTGQ